MADKMMRIAARTGNGTAIPPLADNNGNIGTTRSWKKEWVTIQAELEIRDTSGHNLPVIDVDTIPMYSLRISNRLKVPVTIYFLTDINKTNGYGLNDIDQVRKSITIQPGNGYVIITPDDAPILNYIRYLRMQVVAQSAPTEGVFEAYIVTIK